MEAFIIFILVILLLSWIYDKFVNHSEYYDKQTPNDKLELPAINKPTLQKASELTLFRWSKAIYMNSLDWKNKRKKVLARDNYTCRRCSVTGVPMHVHHTKGYDLIPNEGLDCLVTLCESCHVAEHEEKGYPQTYNDYMSWDEPISKQ